MRNWRFTWLLFGFPICGGLAQAGVRIVERPNLGAFPTLQAAVDAAAEGETLLATAGFYASFTIDGKSLNLQVAGQGQLSIQGFAAVRNLGSAQFVTLQGLSIVATGGGPISGAALQVQSVQGQLRVRNSTFLGASSTLQGLTSGAGVAIQSSLNVVLMDCTITAGNAPWLPGDPPVDGGAGIDLAQSSAALYGCTLRGGKGSEETYPRGGHGGPGASCTGFGLFASQSSFRGGVGGGGDYIGCTTGGVGGDGIRADGAQVHLLADTFTPGTGGWSSCGPFSPAGQDVGLLNGAIRDNLSGIRRRISAPALTPDDQSVPLTIQGSPGDSVYLQVARRPAFQFVKALKGCRLLPAASLGSAVPVGVIGPGGTLVLPITLPVTDGSFAHTSWWQAVCIDTSGVAILTDAVSIVAVDAAGAPDCNGNGRQDMLDVIFQAAPDCDKNLVPDACDPDCDGDGVPDTCEIAGGSVADCNGNGIPDDCDLAAGAPDCNGNGVLDGCDIASHLSADANGNGVPDECEQQFLTWYVDDGAAPGGNGSQAAPFRTIAEALAVSIQGDTIELADGVYQGAGNVALDLGGRDLTLRSANGLANTTIDCGGTTWALQALSGESLTIQGITFTRGFVLGFGGLIRTFQADLVLRDCAFTASRASLGGGALSLDRGSVRMERCFVVGNASQQPGFGYGGGVHVNRAAFRALRTHFEGNVSLFGGAVYIGQTFGPAPEASFVACNFAANSSGNGGAVMLNADSVGLVHTLDNCQFAGNSSGADGGALFAAASFSLTHSTFVDNSAVGRGGAIHLRLNSTGNVRNSMLRGGSATFGQELSVGYGQFPPATLAVEYCDVEGGQAGVAIQNGALQWGAGNFDAIPVFVNPNGPDNNPATYGDNDYLLAPASPGVDAGNVLLLAPDRLDLDGDGNTSEPVPLDLRARPRRFDVPATPDTGVGPAPIVDLGAHESQG